MRAGQADWIQKACHSTVLRYYSYPFILQLTLLSSLTPTCPVPPVRSPPSGANMGRVGAEAGRRAPDARLRHLMRGLFPQRQIHRERGEPAQHDSQRMGLEGAI